MVQLIKRIGEWLWNTLVQDLEPGSKMDICESCRETDQGVCAECKRI